MSPVVSVVIANHNGGAFVHDALRSAARQTLADIEILFVDDASSDGSSEIARRFALQDARIRVIQLPSNAGPAAARNAGLAAASGRWIAILDSDDMMHPERLATLVAEAERSGVDICADDLLVFQEGKGPHPFLTRRQRARPWITTGDFVLSNRIFVRTPALGYLKPLLRTEFLRKHDVRYNPTLRIGEDYDLVLRLLLHGARYRLVDQLGYFYRRHKSSTSHRITRHELEGLLAADAMLDASFGAAAGAVAAERQSWRKSIQRALDFTALVSALQARQWSRAAALAVRHPAAVPLLRMPIGVRLMRLVRIVRRQAPEATEKRACVISRQRLVGSRAGNSAYLLSLCKALRDAGYRLSLISPSPAMFGRWPFLYLSREMELFDEIHMRGSLRLGRRLFLASDPRVLMIAGLTVAERVLVRAGILRRARIKPAPYAIGVPWQRADQLFIARHAPPQSRLIVADYAFVAPAIPYALCPKALAVIVMHDRFSARASQFEALKAADSLSTIDEASELALLSQADAVLAIQANEAAFVAEGLPRQRVVLAPMGVRAVDEPQPGDDHTVLFVGSNTAPNVIGLQWFLDKVWPDVRRRLPDCRLLVAGSVGPAVRGIADGVTLLGSVPDLDPVYAEAGVVISPLFAGTGLKIKLVEALGQGKAIVATSRTIEGVEETVRPAVVLAEEAREFGDAITGLLENRPAREDVCRKALRVAQDEFSTKACYADFLALVHQHEMAGEPAAGDSGREAARIVRTRSLRASGSLDR